MQTTNSPLEQPGFLAYIARVRLSRPGYMAHIDVPPELTEQELRRADPRLQEGNCLWCGKKLPDVDNPRTMKFCQTPVHYDYPDDRDNMSECRYQHTMEMRRKQKAGR